MDKGLTFKGIHSSTLGLYLLSDPVTVKPNSRDEYSYVPGRAGTIINSEEPEDIIKEVTFGVISTDIDDLKSKARQIANWLHSTSKEKLQFDGEDVHYIGKVANQIDMTYEIEQFGEFTVLFRCEPYALSEQKTIREIITTSGQTITVVNYGTAKTPPIIKIKNTGSSTINGFTLEVRAGG